MQPSELWVYHAVGAARCNGTALMVLSLLQLSALGLSACLVAALWTRRKRQRLPPGPPGKFLIGNLYDFPRPPEEWKAFADFGKLYGE